MHEKKYFIPAEGMSVYDPLNRKPVPAAGKWVMASDYWHRRAADGGGTLNDKEPEETAGQVVADPPRLELAPASDAPA